VKTARSTIVDASRMALNAQEHILVMGTAVPTQTMVNELVLLGVRLMFLLMITC
jgi:hypothetical protein